MSQCLHISSLPKSMPNIELKHCPNVIWACVNLIFHHTEETDVMKGFSVTFYTMNELEISSTKK